MRKIILTLFVFLFNYNDKKLAQVLINIATPNSNGLSKQSS